MFFIGILLTLFLSHAEGGNYEGVYNYNNHSYYFSSSTRFMYYINYYCNQDSYYAAAITSSKENIAVSSVLRENRGIGISRMDVQFIVVHTGKKANYTNMEPGVQLRHNSYVVIKSTNGKWILFPYWYYTKTVCEYDKISSSGVNLTDSKMIQINYNSLVTYRGHSYYVYTVYRDYETIVKICKNDHNGYVFIPNDGMENCAINTRNHGFVYLGITQIWHQFITAKGYKATYLPWTNNFPNNRICVSRSHINGEFRTQSCYTKKHIICETDSVVSGAKPIDCNQTLKHYYFAQILHHDNYLIRIFDFNSTKKEANLLCRRRGDVLYVPLNQNENCAIMENVIETLGLNYGQNNVKHILTRGDNILSNYTNWASGYPKSDDNKMCVYAHYDSGKWTNDVCYNSTFACREFKKGLKSNTNCSQRYFQPPSNAYTYSYHGKTYSLFARNMRFHDSVRLCSYYGQSLLQTTDSMILNQVSQNIIDINFHVDYRILWNDTQVKWMSAVPSGTINWAQGEPKTNDFMISCVSVTVNKTWVTNLCRDEYVAVCVGNSPPTVTTTTSKTSSTTTTTTTTTTITTTTTTTTTPPPTSTLHQSKAASSKSNKVAVGVGAFFGIVGVVVVVLGLLYFIKKRGLNFSSPRLSSLGSFRRQN